MATIELGGKTRDFKMELEELMDAEDALELPIRPLIINNRGLTARQIIAILWGVWWRVEPGLTRAQVQVWVRDYLRAGHTLLHLENLIVNAVIESKILLPIAEASVRPSSGAATDMPPQEGNGSATSSGS